MTGRAGEAANESADVAVRDTDAAWRLLLAAAARRRAGTLPPAPGAWRLTGDDEREAAHREDRHRSGPSDGESGPGAPDDGPESTLPDDALGPTFADDERAVLVRGRDGTFSAGPAVAADVRDFVELYLPMLGAADDRPYVLAHLGQSVDASIASVDGENDVVTGPEDFAHMHRLRALADAVLVGAGTVAADDPRLTVRLVDGPDPVRVVLDPSSRLSDDVGVFRDGASPTLRVRSTRAPRGDDGGARGDAGHDSVRDAGPPFGVDVLDVPSDDDGLSLGALLDTLYGRGLRVVIIEGGGVTVTRWLQAARLDRLHLVAAPLLLGDARPALRLPGAPNAAAARRPPHRLYQLGEDVLWDFDLRGEPADPAAGRAGTPFRRLT